MRNFLTLQEQDSEVGGGKPFYARIARRGSEGTCSADYSMIWWRAKVTTRSTAEVMATRHGVRTPAAARALCSTSCAVRLGLQMRCGRMGSCVLQRLRRVRQGRGSALRGVQLVGRCCRLLQCTWCRGPVPADDHLPRWAWCGARGWPPDGSEWRRSVGAVRRRWRQSLGADWSLGR